MPSNDSRVSSAALIELKTDLTHLSESLHEIYDLMNADMSQVGEYWEDPKYAEFVSGYQPQIAKCEEISERYSEWCKRVLDPTIEKVIAIETTDVGGDGGSSGGGGAAAAAVSGENSSNTSNNDKLAGFNMGNNNPKSSERPRSPQPQPWPYNQRNKQQGLHWDKPYSTPQPPTSTSRPTPPPSKPSDSGFDPRENERPRLSPAEIAQLLNGRQR